ncbi:MAG: hypothetical protein MJB57_15270, partial [Gemmatimonadetes bacterium]|nr:hypothetical protein [Gemmatimonadota bacterium]
MPAFGRGANTASRISPLMIDEVGRLWVQSYLAFPDETPAWSVYGRDGRLLAEISGPVGFEITYADEGRVVGRWTDALGVERVRIYAIED